MKKIFQLVAVLLVAVIAFTSCNKAKEDLYFPKQKLTSVSSDKSGMMLNIHYDGKYISKILFEDEEMNVIYSGKQITEINMPSENSKLLLSYQDGKVVRIDCFENDVEYSYLVFTRNAKGKISNVTTYADEDLYDNWKKRCDSKLFDLVFDVKAFKNMLEMSASKGTFSAFLSEDWEYEGNNVVKTLRTIDMDGMSYSYVTDYEYDENHNPYYGLPYFLGTTDSYSENNVVKTTTYISWNGMSMNSSVSTNTYTYDNNKYPLSCTSTANEEQDVVHFTYIK